MPDLKALGESKTTYPMTYDPTSLESFPNPQTDVEYVIEIEAPEFTCLCPKTGQPDFGEILISYAPDLLCLESKSLKLYLFSFRQTGAFHEDVTNRIARDLYNLLNPNWVQVTGKFKARGGITFHPTVRLEKDFNMEGEDSAIS